MNREKQYTSSANKLLGHMYRLEMGKKNKWYPINLQLSPTEICNLNCSFCSVKERGAETLDYDKMISALDDFIELGIKSVEITGGGDPTMYPYINDLISYLHYKDISIGLITNGIELSKYVKKQSLKKLKWLRISLNGIDQGFTYKDIPKIKGTLGFSYVWNKTSDVKKLKQIYKLAKINKVKYVRIVPDCLIPKEQLRLRGEVNSLVEKLKMTDMIFVQTKNYQVYPNRCWIGALKPFLYTDGYIYQCSAVALYNRKFDKKWRICHMNDIKKVWPNNYKPINPKMCEEGKCFYCEHNKILDEMQQKVDHHGFI